MSAHLPPDGDAPQSDGPLSRWQPFSQWTHWGLWEFIPRLLRAGLAAPFLPQFTWPRILFLSLSLAGALAGAQSTALTLAYTHLGAPQAPWGPPLSSLQAGVGPLSAFLSPLHVPPPTPSSVSLYSSLRPLDIEFMKRLSKVVNIVPVIAKADTLTLEERVYFKQRVGLCLCPPSLLVGARPSDKIPSFYWMEETVSIRGQMVTSFPVTVPLGLLSEQEGEPWAPVEPLPLSGETPHSYSQSSTHNPLGPGIFPACLEEDSALAMDVSGGKRTRKPPKLPPGICAQGRNDSCSRDVIAEHRPYRQLSLRRWLVTVCHSRCPRVAWAAAARGCPGGVQDGDMPCAWDGEPGSLGLLRSPGGQVCSCPSSTPEAQELDSIRVTSPPEPTPDSEPGATCFVEVTARADPSGLVQFAAWTVPTCLPSGPPDHCGPAVQWH